MTPAYEAPALGEHDDWRGYKDPNFVPNARQQRVMDAVAAAMAEGLSYSKQILERCTVTLAPTAEQLARGTKGVEGGNFGMDLYYARGVLKEQKSHAFNMHCAARVRLQVGDKLGPLVFSDGKLVRSATVESVGPTEFLFSGTRGSLKVRSSITYSVLNDLIERAFILRKRNDGFDAFCSLRAATHAKAVMLEVASSQKAGKVRQLCP